MVSQRIFKSFTHVLVYSAVWCKMVWFHFFACTSPVLPTSFIEEAIFTILYAPASFVKYHGFVSGLFSVPLIYMPVLMPVPGCFDHSGLVV